MSVFEPETLEEAKAEIARLETELAHPERGFWGRLAAMATKRSKHFERALTRHRHTDECREYAIRTGIYVCSDDCIASRKAVYVQAESELGSMELVPRVMLDRLRFDLQTMLEQAANTNQMNRELLHRLVQFVGLTPVWQRNEADGLVPKPPLPHDPVHYAEIGDERQGYGGPGWYFWDEIWTTQHGPYPTRAAADAALDSYVRRELQGEQDDRQD